jgi:hypothetical protein
MKKFVFLVIALLAVVSLAGCGGGNNGGTDNDTNGNGNGDGNGTETAQWAAYAFGDTVKPNSGGSGKIKSFTIDSTYSDEGKARKFAIEGTYLGTETTQIATQKMVTSSTPPYITTSNVTTSLECYKLKHRVTVVLDETNETHPQWADITIWIPTADFGTSVSYFWIYPKATYLDSDGHKGEWSYYLTEAMKNDTTASYLPVTEGDFYGYDDWMLFGLYGWGYYWFQGFAEGGQQQLRVATWAYGGCSYSCSKGNKTIGSYTFSAWTLDASCTYQGGSGGYKGIFSHDLPLPIYLKVASSGEGSSNYFEYTLTGLQLQ